MNIVTIWEALQSAFWNFLCCFFFLYIFLCPCQIISIWKFKYQKENYPNKNWSCRRRKHPGAVNYSCGIFLKASAPVLTMLLMPWGTSASYSFLLCRPFHPIISVLCTLKLFIFCIQLQCRILKPYLQGWQLSQIYLTYENSLFSVQKKQHLSILKFYPSPNYV